MVVVAMTVMVAVGLGGYGRYGKYGESGKGQHKIAKIHWVKFLSSPEFLQLVWHCLQTTAGAGGER